MDLTISTNVLTRILNISWKSESESRETYVVHVIDNSTSAQIEQINTTDSHVQYDLRNLYSVDCKSLPSIVFSVSAVLSWLDGVSCTSEESETKAIPDVIQGCTYQGRHIINPRRMCEGYGDRSVCVTALPATYLVSMSQIRCYKIPYGISIVHMYMYVLCEFS
jgi:hypothetical protein